MVNAPLKQPNPGAFALPPTAVARHPDALLSSRDMRRWLDGLPLANPPKAAQQLLHQLRLLVRDPQPGARLGQLLPLYEQTIDQLLQIVHERLQNNPDHAVPLDQLEHLTIELLNEFAYGHLRIANQVIADNRIPEVTALYRAMTLLDSTLHIERQHYCRLAPQAWSLLLHIFLLAEHLHLANEPVAWAGRVRDAPASIRGLFFRALLINLCDPHRHLPSEIQQWYDWTGAHTELLDLTILPQGSAAIPVDISGARTPLAAARRGKPGSAMRYLESERFVTCLDEDPLSPKGLLQTLHDLVHGRKSAEQRESPRQASKRPFRLLHGLHGIHRRLTELTGGDSSGWNELSPVACRQVDDSHSGAAFSLQGPLNPPLSVGEAILVEADVPGAGSMPVGFAGRVARLVTDARQQIEIGVEKLPGRLVPVALAGSAADRIRGTNYAVLLHATEGERHLLLAPRSVFREGELVTVESQQERYHLRMQRLVANSQHIAYIAVEIGDA